MQETPSHILRPPANVLIPWWYLIPLYAIILIGILAVYPSVSPLVIVAGIVVLFVTVYYPEIPLVAFVLIGVTKPWFDENITIFQTIDYTAFLALYIFILLFITMVRRGTNELPSFIHFVIPLIMFSVVLMIGVVYSSAPNYGFEKAFRFFIFNILLFFTTIVFIKDERDIKRIFVVVIGLSFVFATIMFYDAAHHFLSGDVTGLIVRMTILGANPIASARLFSIAFIILLVGAYFAKRRRNKLFLYFLSGYFLIALIITNTRGPLVSTLVAVIVFLLFLSEMKLKTIAMYFGGFVAAIVMAFLLLPDFATSRYEVFLEAGAVQQAMNGAETDTIQSRILMWSMAFSGAFESIWTFMLGHGTGSFASLFHFGDFRWYPHNILMEIVFELGLLGLLLFSVHLFQIVIVNRGLILKTRSSGEYPLIVVVTTLAVSVFAAALVSGDLADNRNIWFLFGLIISLHRVQKMKFIKLKEGNLSNT
jgi:O-antigen ligase